MRAIHYLAIDAECSDDPQWLLRAIRDMSRSTFKGVDACVERLTGNVGAGDFETEFDEE